MDKSALLKLLRQYRRGTLDESDIVEAISVSDDSHLGFAVVDHRRELRRGFPEVIFAQGKSPAQVASIGVELVRRGSPMLATRATDLHYKAVRRKIRGARYNPIARIIAANEGAVHQRGKGPILVVTAGTSDIPVAEEAVETARMMGNTVQTLYDVGVAGMHRVLRQSRMLRAAEVIVVVAGMEGALASVVGGLVAVPVIAVPTSVGYGAHFQGLAPLLGMLNSCASGVTVVNIDNGFGAGYAASLINRRRD